MQILIRNVLDKKNKTPYWLAKQIGMSYTNLSNLINNKTSSLRFDFLEKICIALNCTPNDILKIEDPTKK